MLQGCTVVSLFAEPDRVHLREFKRWICIEVLLCNAVMYVWLQNWIQVISGHYCCANN